MNLSIKKYSNEPFNFYHFSTFVAQETMVEIIPRFSMRCVPSCFGGFYGPFSPNYPIDVPLWLAAHLRQTDTCTITVPEYCRVDFLSKVLHEERQNDVSFTPLPFHIFEVVRLLLQYAFPDIPQPTEVLRLIDLLRSVRHDKITHSMALFEAENSILTIPGMKVSNLVSTELQYLRRSFASVLEKMSDLEVCAKKLPNLKNSRKNSSFSTSYSVSNSQIERIHNDFTFPQTQDSSVFANSDSHSPNHEDTSESTHFEEIGSATQSSGVKESLSYSTNWENNSVYHKSSNNKERRDNNLDHNGRAEELDNLMSRGVQDSLEIASNQSSRTMTTDIVSDPANSSSDRSRILLKKRRTLRNH